VSRISLDDLDLAAQWLDCNEGENGEMGSCHRVRDWLLAEIKRREKEATIRTAMKQTGATRRTVVRALDAVEITRQMTAERTATP
jgi:hypothetical protein